MLRSMLKSKIHRAVVTETDLEYVGSITLDKGLMAAAGILPYEQVQVLNLSNGNRLVTYAIQAPKGSRKVCLNGAAALLAEPGDLVIILSYGMADEAEAKACKPAIVFVDRKNRITRTVHAEKAGERFSTQRGRR